MDKTITLFYAYAPADEALRADLEKQLTQLQRQNLIASWHSGAIMAGQELLAETEQHWQEAQLILLLISADFLASSEYYSLVERSMDRHKAGTAQVVPILLRPVDWQGTPFDNLAILPSNKQAVTIWENRDEAFAQIARGIRLVVEELSTKQEHQSSALGQQIQTSHESIQREKTLLFLETLPLTDARTIQQREQLVQTLYNQLIRLDLSTLVITGLGGTGKSTLAALLYKHAETQRQAGQGPFIAQAIWINATESTTSLDLAEILLAALDTPQSRFASLLPQKEAHALYQVLSMTTEPRLIVINQFDYLLDKQSGKVLANRPGLGEWLDLLNRYPLNSRFLFTSRIWPKSKSEEVPTCMQEYLDHGLEVAEGIQMLRQQGVTESQASDEDLRIFVTQTTGHALALTLLAAILRRNPNLTFYDLIPKLTSPASTTKRATLYNQLWEQDIAQQLLDYLYHQLSGVQRQLLRAFSIYREPVSLEAAWELIERVTSRQLLKAFEVLRTHHLLQESGEKRYQLHAIVANYAQKRFHETNARINIQVVQAAHATAARYYRRIPIPPRPQRRHSRDISPLLEICWHLCQAKQWQEAYNLLLQESLFIDLRRWGAHARILELCVMFPAQEKWKSTEKEKANVYKNMGRAYADLGYLQDAREAYIQAVHLFQLANDSNGVGTTLNNLGRLIHVSGDQAEALTYHTKALKIFEEREDRSGQGTTLNNIGACHQQLGELEKAQHCYEQALYIFEDVRYFPGQARALNDLGRIAQIEGRNADAQDFFTKSLQLYQATADQRGAGWSLYNLGLLAVETGQAEQAWQYFVQATLARRSVNHLEGEANALYHLGKLALSLEVDKRALAFLIYAQQLFKQLNHPELSALQKDLEICQRVLGTEAFAVLYKEAESQAAIIVEQFLQVHENPFGGDCR